MLVRVLGTAAGGGIPQWNCACPGCSAAREQGWARRQDCLAVSADGDGWYLLNCPPDLRLDPPELRPGPGPRETPLRGVLLTSAELDHTLGLATLREADHLTVYGSAPVLAAAPALPLLDSYTKVDRQVLAGGPTTLPGGLVVSAFALGGKRPRYAAESEAAPDWVIGLRLRETATGATLVYAPCLAEWSAELTGDLVFLDGTCWDDDELPRQTGAGRTARTMGHLPITGSLPLLPAGPRYLYTHLNNTNPAARDDSPERELIRARGADVAAEGGLLTVCG